MLRKNCLRVGSLILPMLACTPCVDAQVVRHLDHVRFETDNARMLSSVVQLVSSDGAAMLWPSGDIGWVFVRSSGQQRNREDIAADQTDATLASIPMPSNHGPGALAKIGVDLDPAVDVIGRDALRIFVIDRALQTDPARIDALPAEVRVLRVESCTLLVRSDDMSDIQPQPSPVATQKAGQQLEIRPLFDPTVFGVGSDLLVRVYVAGNQLVGEPLTVVPPVIDNDVDGGVDGASCTLPTNDKGIATVHLDRPGRWTLELAHLVIAPSETHEAVLYTSSLTFDVPDGVAHEHLANDPRAPTEGDDTTGGRP